MEALVARVRKRAFLFGALGMLGAFAFGWRSGASLTIAALVVIFSFLVLQKLTERLVPQQTRIPFRSLVPLLLVTGVSLVGFGILLFRWKGFDPVAGAVGLSIVVLAIVPELWIDRA